MPLKTYEQYLKGPLTVGFLAFCLFLALGGIAGAQENSKKTELQQQIQQLEEEAKKLDVDLQSAKAETKSLASETKTIDTEVKSREVAIKRIGLEIKEAAKDIIVKSENIDILSKKIEKSRKAIAAGIISLSKYDSYSPLAMLLGYGKLSDFFGSLENLTRLQATLQLALEDFKSDRALLTEEKDELEDFRREQEDLKALQEVERKFLAQKKKEKEELLRLTKGKETLYQQILQVKKKDIASLKTQLFYLEKTGITAEDAMKYADLAASRAGIRTAFLLALLEVETGKQFEDGVISVGTNLGTGNWQRDLYNCYINLGKRKAAEAEKAAFLKITESLGLDPDKMPVSRKPSYGCGGAMGPAQFLPTTWLRFSSRVAKLTGHDPANPWNVEDAFTASALFLADSGATSKTAQGESRAARTYISGSPTCTRYICNLYAGRIAELTKEIDRIL